MDLAKEKEKVKKVGSEPLTKQLFALYNKRGKRDFERSFTDMGSVFTGILNAGNVGAAINVINDQLNSLAGKINVPSIAMFIVGAVIALLVGLFGYKYIKLLSMVVFGAAGYAIGEKIFSIFKSNPDANIHDAFKYVFGIALLALLGYLAYKMFAYAMFGMACAFGFLVCYFLYPSYFVAIAGGIVVAMLAMNYVRYAFIGILSVVAGFLTMGMLGGMFPDVKLLSLTEGIVGQLLAVVLAVLFIAFQLRFSNGQSKAGVLGGKILGKSGPKRVKIRRVFDAW